MHKRENTFKINKFYYVAKIFFNILFKIFFRVKVINPERIPLHPFIIFSNHSSNLDPPLIGAYFKGELYFMAKMELFEIPVLSFLLKRLNVFPVKRGDADKNAVIKALDILKEGKSLAIFPEGTRTHTGLPDKVKKGACMLVFRSGLPVVPVYLNTHSVLPRHKKIPNFNRIYVKIGKPIKPVDIAGNNKNERYTKLAEYVENQWEELRVNE